jgi:hypothetical protein
VRHPTAHDDARVYLPRATRTALANLSADRREALYHGLLRVGRRLLDSAEAARVSPSWARRTWPRRRYPQQCYPKTATYVLDHLEIDGLQLVHGVASHAPHFLPFDHAWVELPGDVVFDGVVQTFFTRGSYYAVMAAVALDAYSGPETRRLVATHGHPGPWNVKWVPTPEQLVAYAQIVRARQAAGVTPPPTDTVDRNR